MAAYDLSNFQTTPDQIIPYKSIQMEFIPYWDTSLVESKTDLEMELINPPYTGFSATPLELIEFAKLHDRPLGSSWETILWIIPEIIFPHMTFETLFSILEKQGNFPSTGVTEIDNFLRNCDFRIFQAANFDNFITDNLLDNVHAELYPGVYSFIIIPINMHLIAVNKMLITEDVIIEYPLIPQGFNPNVIITNYDPRATFLFLCYDGLTGHKIEEGVTIDITSRQQSGNTHHQITSGNNNNNLLVSTPDLLPFDYHPVTREITSSFDIVVQKDGYKTCNKTYGNATGIEIKADNDNVAFFFVILVPENYDNGTSTIFKL
jgi:hypothetical protein